jgi:hypothetical protein
MQSLSKRLGPTRKQHAPPIRSVIFSKDTESEREYEYTRKDRTEKEGEIIPSAASGYWGFRWNCIWPTFWNCCPKWLQYLDYNLTSTNSFCSDVEWIQKALQ